MLILAAVLPALVFLLVAYGLDRHKEHPRQVGLLYLVGALIVLPAGLAEKYLLDLYALTDNPTSGFLASLLIAFFVAGATEETIKAVAFRRLVYSKPFFDEPYDGALYAAAIGLGFATVENVLYVLSSGLPTAFVRAFTAVPAHALFGIVMGSYFSQSKFAGGARWKPYVIPALLHGTYDTFAMAQSFWANLALIGFLMWLVRFAFMQAKPLLRGDDNRIVKVRVHIKSATPVPRH